MLKLNTSFSKKVPAESEYSSKSYHASIEMELPDGLSEAQIKERIHGTFELVRNSFPLAAQQMEPRWHMAPRPFPMEEQQIPL